MEKNGFEKSKVFTIVESLDYKSDAVGIRPILKKPTGSVSLYSFYAGEGLTKQIKPFDTLIQIIDGYAEITIGDKTNLVKNGESIIVPANSRHRIKAIVNFKMLLTMIKSGYEEMTL